LQTRLLHAAHCVYPPPHMFSQTRLLHAAHCMYPPPHMVSQTRLLHAAHCVYPPPHMVWQTRLLHAAHCTHIYTRLLHIDHIHIYCILYTPKHVCCMHTSHCIPYTRLLHTHTPTHVYCIVHTMHCILYSHLLHIIHTPIAYYTHV
jgi:hypothetical protein